MDKNQEARKEFRRLKRKTHEKRVVYLRQLEPEIRWRVARLAAGGELPDE